MMYDEFARNFIKQDDTAYSARTKRGRDDKGRTEGKWEGRNVVSRSRNNGKRFVAI
jgi:hypothetical protein